MYWIFSVTFALFSRWEIWKSFWWWPKTMATLCRLYWQCRKVCVSSFLFVICRVKSKSSGLLNILNCSAAFLILQHPCILPISFRWHLLEILPRYYTATALSLTNNVIKFAPLAPNVFCKWVILFFLLITFF